MRQTRRRRYLVTYDIADDKRRDKVFQELHGFGDWAQFSVFLCELSDRDLVRLRVALRREIHEAEDQVMILDLGRAQLPVESSLEVLGRSYQPTIRSFIV